MKKLQNNQLKVINGEKSFSNTSNEPNHLKVLLNFEDLRLLYGSTPRCCECNNTEFYVNYTVVNSFTNILYPADFLSPIEQILQPNLICDQCDLEKHKSVSDLLDINRLPNGIINAYLQFMPKLKQLVFKINPEYLYVDTKDRRTKFSTTTLYKADATLIYYDPLLYSTGDLKECPSCGDYNHTLMFGSTHVDVKELNKQYDYFGPLLYCDLLSIFVVPFIMQEMMREGLRGGYQRMVFKPDPYISGVDDDEVY